MWQVMAEDVKLAFDLMIRQNKRTAIHGRIGRGMTGVSKDVAIWLGKE